MNKRFVLSVLFIGITTFVKNAYAETLHEAVQHTLETNPQVRAVQQNRLARTQEVKQARAGYFPTLDFSAGIGRNEIFSPNEYELGLNEKGKKLASNVPSEEAVK